MIAAAASRTAAVSAAFRFEVNKPVNCTIAVNVTEYNRGKSTGIKVGTTVGRRLGVGVTMPIDDWRQGQNLRSTSLGAESQVP